MSGYSYRRTVSLAAVGIAALAGAGVSVAVASPSALEKCASIDAAGDRLACYDQLAGRKPAAAGAATSAVPPRPVPQSTSPSTPPSASVTPPAPAASSGTPLPKESFGLYSAEHPAAPKGVADLTAAVVGLSVDANGHMKVSLEGGQLWLFDDDPDPVLAKGQAVTIRRARLGSFLLTTPSGRIHRVHRLQ